MTRSATHSSGRRSRAAAAWVWVLLGAGLGASGCRSEPAVEAAATTSAPAAPPSPFDADELRRILQLSPLPPPPPDPTNRLADDPAAASLGRLLFFDTRLSRNGRVACVTCHDPEQGWSDGKPLAEGRLPLERHSQTLFNAAYQRWFFWDGRTDSLWAQALVPLEEPREHALTRVGLVRLLGRVPELAKAYAAVFGPLPDVSDSARFPAEARPIRRNTRHPEHLAWEAMDAGDREQIDRAFTNVGKALAAFVAGITATRSPFDDFVRGLRTGDARAVSAYGDAERRGLKLFLGRARCHFCHAGPLFSDREFHDNRIPVPGGNEPTDAGRFQGLTDVLSDPFNGKGAFSDAPSAAAVKLDYLVRSSHSWGEFKTPGLRNVELTAPYMHRGQFATLEEVVRYYSTLEGARPAHHESSTALLEALHLSDDEQADLVAFLKSLTDPEPFVATAPATVR